MCGLFALLNLGTGPLPDDAAQRTTRALHAIRHRGPDATGLHVDPAGRFVLGHVRLSVIDLSSASNQPLWSECGRYAIVFNGEIYNYIELRRELEAEGLGVRTASDTEVLLKCLIHWGSAGIDRLNGMWAFVFVDTATGQAIVSRDRWGVKPLYMLRSGPLLLACSEIKGLLAFQGSSLPPDHESIGTYLRFGMGGECRNTWFRGVERFPQATSEAFTLGSPNSTATRYWSYPTTRDIHDPGEAMDGLRAALSDAIRIRMRSDVPFGLSLSGGIDSSVIAWLASVVDQRPLSSYTAFSEPREQSELPRAQLIASRFGHACHPILQSDAHRTLDDLRDCIYHLDAPHNSPAIVPYIELCRAARNSLTVMLEGQGADELLGGYLIFGIFAALNQFHRGEVAQGIRSARTAIADQGLLSALANVGRYGSRRIYLRQAIRWGAHDILGAECLRVDPGPLRTLGLGQRDNFEEALRFWHERSLTNLLQYGDAISMAVNLETRCPFLDRRVVELGFRMDTDLLFHDGFGKHILRQLASGTVPDEVLWRRHKDGFTNPTMALVQTAAIEHGWPALGLDLALQHGIVTAAIRDPSRIRRLGENATFRLFSMMLWMEEFQSGKPLR
ncbi:MAG: asparagine synthase (glutamine-hydrolyzing) [Planctomycetes bacterium]|nr:asparagine synthase (glutamine-hydrolyzing) [Planctomycetota bacterium]